MIRNTIIFFSILIYLNLPWSADAKLENKIVIKVENKIITNFEIKNKILTTLLIAGDDINQENVNKLKKQALEALIQLKLKEIELSKYNIKKNQTQINNYLKSISSNNVENLKKKFIQNNLDYDLFLNDVETQIKWQSLIYKIYSKRIEIDELSIDLELKEIVKAESSIKEFNISEIEILLDNKDNSKIQEIQNEIKINGFGKTALKYSISSSSSDKGNLGWINSKSLSKDIYDKLSKMKIGEISEPIRRPESVLLLKLNDVRKSEFQNIDITNLKENLINQKRNELFNLYSRSHLSKLKNSSFIQYK